jgi:uncharacterized membrane protein
VWNLAHLHIAINHVPVVLAPVALVLFVVALWRASVPALRTGIVVAWVSGSSALAAYFTGDPAADLVMEAEKAQKAALNPRVEEHEESAAWALGASMVLAAAGVWGWRRPGAGRQVTIPLVVLSGLTTLILARTAELGGQIRHPESRPGFVAPAPQEHEHEHGSEHAGKP